MTNVSEEGYDSKFAALRARQGIMTRLTPFLEVALIVAVFVAYGAWPTPDVNEQYYVGKAIHFWNHDWLGNDPFLNTPDSHWLFYATFGLFSFLFSQNVMVWVGRVLVWLATACAWRRLSRVLLPIPFFCVLTATGFAFYLESFHLAGEWIIGGVEGKSFAFPLVFWGLSHFFEGKYNRGWILMGMGAAFHALVGGWTVLACLLSWMLERLFNRRLRGTKTFFKDLTRMLPGLVIGGLVSLLGVVPALRLDQGATREIIAESRRIYVYERLSHHLVASSLPWTFLGRFSCLVLAFALVAVLGALLTRRWRPDHDAGALAATSVERERFFRLNAFVCAACLFAAFGATVDWGSKWLAESGRIADYHEAAGILRYYWYRLSDWAVPFGLVFGVARLAKLLFDVLLKKIDEKRRAGDGTRFLYDATASGALTLLGVLAAYWGFRFVFYRHAVAVAKAIATDALLPLPKPTEGLSFIATVDFLGAFLLLAFAGLWFFKGRRLSKDDENAPRIPSTPLLTAFILWIAIIGFVGPMWRLAYYVDLRGVKVIPRSAPPKESIADGWIDACEWARDNTPQEAVFLVPRGCESFKWHAHRAEAGNWKEIPQDAKSIVKWNRKMEHFYANPGEAKDSPTRWNQALNVVFINKGLDRVLKESERYGYQYAVVETPPYTIFSVPEAARRWQIFIDRCCVYSNPQFVVLKLHDLPSREKDSSTKK